ncbi:hypothetical protein EI94DRAFT_1702359 [Lactarius quietus]|nr:hypothetical protein EI94DRAFT_1702359 [Lactarius quietus]
MHHPLSANSPSEGLETSPQGHQPLHAGFEITSQDSDILMQYLDDFQAANKQDQPTVVDTVMGRLYAIQPPDPTFNQAEAKMKVKKWFYNHYERSKHQYTKFTCKWSARSAFYQLNHVEVKQRVTEVSGHEPGHPSYLGCLQDATTYLWNALSPNDKEEYVIAASEWSKTTPPKNVQSRMAASIRKRVIQDFQSQLYKTCGIHTLVLTAYEGEDGDLKVGLDDGHSTSIGGPNFFEFCPDYENAVLWQEWIQFGIKCFSSDTVESLPKKYRSKTVTTHIPITLDVNGSPDLPEITMHHGYKTKVVQSMLREYCTAHIRFSTGIKKQIIPWGALVKDPYSWISEELSDEETFQLPLSEECEEGDDDSPKIESNLGSNDTSSQEDELEQSDEQSQSVHTSDRCRKSGMNHIYIKVLHLAHIAYLILLNHQGVYMCNGIETKTLRNIIWGKGRDSATGFTLSVEHHAPVHT